MGKPRDTVVDQIGAFVMVPTFVLDAVRDANAVHCYAILRRCANHERVAWPGQERIARDMGASLSTVQRALRTLRDAHVLETEPRREHGFIVGTNYLLLSLDSYKSRVTHRSTVESTQTQDIAVGQTTDDDSTRQTYTSKVTAHNKELTRSIELDPKSEETTHTRRATDIYDADPELIGTHAAAFFALFRAGWEDVYKYPPSLLRSPLDLMKVESHLRTIGLDRLGAALVGFFASDDDFVRRRKHPLGLFLINPSQYNVDALPSVQRTAHTADEQRQQTRAGNVAAVADGRLARRLAGDES